MLPKTISYLRSANNFKMQTSCRALSETDVHIYLSVKSLDIYLKYFRYLHQMFLLKHKII